MDNVVFNGVHMIRDTRNGYQGFSTVGASPDPWNCKVRGWTQNSVLLSAIYIDLNFIQISSIAVMYDVFPFIES